MAEEETTKLRVKTQSSTFKVEEQLLVGIDVAVLQGQYKDRSEFVNAAVRSHLRELGIEGKITIEVKL